VKRDLIERLSENKHRGPSAVYTWSRLRPSTAYGFVFSLTTHLTIRRKQIINTRIKTKSFYKSAPWNRAHQSTAQIFRLLVFGSHPCRAPRGATFAFEDTNEEYSIDGDGERKNNEYTPRFCFVFVFFFFSGSKFDRVSLKSDSIRSRPRFDLRRRRARLGIKKKKYALWTVRY
jgi:hypothetical protein